MTRALLFSGGLDSLCLWYLTGRPRCVYVRIGHTYESAELFAVGQLNHRIADLDVTVVDGPKVGPLEAPDGHIPHRNLALITAAAAFLPDVDEVMLGALLGEASPDKSSRFLRRTAAALSASEGRRLRVTAPGRRWTKTGLLRRFLHQFPDHVAELAITRSCYSVIAAGPCGQCPACFRRAVALWHVGLRDRPVTLPAVASAGAAWTAARRAGVARWPGMAVNNAMAGAALAGWRRPRTGRGVA